MKTYIQITGGRGPVECARTVALVAKELQEEYPDLELVDYEAHNTEPGCFMSMTLSTNSENVSQMKAEWAKDTISIEAFQQSMEGIFSTSVCPNTIDESPMAYKDTQEIISLMEPTCVVEYFMKPVINIKDTSDYRG